MTSYFLGQYGFPTACGGQGEVLHSLGLHAALTAHSTVAAPKLHGSERTEARAAGAPWRDFPRRLGRLHRAGARYKTVFCQEHSFEWKACI